MAALPLLLFSLSVFFHACKGANFVVPPNSNSNSHVVYACAGQKVTLNWDYSLSQGESIEDIMWHYGDSPSQLVAIFADNHFVPLPEFTGRVEKFGNAGLSLNNVRVADSGNYTVAISIHSTTGSFVTLRETVFLQVGDSLMTQDGYLHVTQSTLAVKNPHTGEWAIELQCGIFIYRADPPFNMEWSTPSSTKASTSYDSNFFKLLVDNPVEGGDYSCHIPSRDFLSACLHPNETNRGQATLYVDKVMARLTILDSENKELKDLLRNVSANCTCP